MNKNNTGCRKVIRRVQSQYRNRVRACRLRAEIPKQELLSLRTGIPRTTISALENNRLFLSSQYALLIRDALGCTLDELYERADQRPGRNGSPAQHKA
ncbi:MAG: helix-turn-helix transcriptional regulator [Armatimonadota bacterium]